ncbi:hypothetical protein D3C71_22490 [compost metagenome]
MPKLILDPEDSLFDDPNVISLRDADEEEDEDDTAGMSAAERRRLEEGCMTLGSGGMRRLRPAGYGPDADDSPGYYD